MINYNTDFYYKNILIYFISSTGKDNEHCCYNSNSVYILDTERLFILNCKQSKNFLTLLFYTMIFKYRIDIDIHIRSYEDEILFRKKFLYGYKPFILCFYNR